MIPNSTAGVVPMIHLAPQRGIRGEARNRSRVIPHSGSTYADKIQPWKIQRHYRHGPLRKPGPGGRLLVSRAHSEKPVYFGVVTLGGVFACKPWIRASVHLSSFSFLAFNSVSSADMRARSVAPPVQWWKRTPEMNPSRNTTTNTNIFFMRRLRSFSRFPYSAQFLACRYALRSRSEIGASV